MPNLIAVLEFIGTDAALRHATGADLESMLEAMHASEELKRAAHTGDAQYLRQELGVQAMGVNNTPINGGCEEEEQEDDDAEAGEKGNQKPGQDHQDPS